MQIDLTELTARFYPSPNGPKELGEFEAVDSVPEPFNQLLNHHQHMTVTVESFHDQRVDVVVHRCDLTDHWYTREITLLTERTRRPVLYGLPRLDTTALPEEAWRQIESQQTPLGRVLIEHQVLCEVQLCGLWRVRVGASLASLLDTPIGDLLYGRTALIYCNGKPAIELLEIVTGTQ